MYADVGRDGSDDEQRGRREMGTGGGCVYRGRPRQFPRTRGGGRLESGVERWDIAEISAWFGSRVHTELSSLALAIIPLLIPRPLLSRY